MNLSKIRPFSLSEVRLCQEGVAYQKMMKNADYLLSLDLDRLLHNFRVYAKMNPIVEGGYGGWEGSWSDGRGTFVGHYLAALCNTYQSTSHAALRKKCKDRVYYLVESLGQVQQALADMHGVGYPETFGYLAAVPTTQLDCIENQTNGGVFSDGVPYYVHHKMLRGMLHAYQVMGNEKAKVIALGMAAYFYNRNKDFPREKLEKMMNSHRYPVQYFKEFGGMQEVLLQWYQATDEVVFDQLAAIFDRDRFRKDLIQNRDELGLNMQHANSEIPCVVGMAKHYEAKGDEEYKTGVLNFLRWMEEDHSSPIGAISGKSAYPDYNSELFHYPKIMYNHMVGEHVRLSSGESCCSHNLNLLSEHAFMWTQDSCYMDRFETRYVNAVLGQQDEKTGMFVYNLNIQPDSKKEFGTPDDSFWCCYCSGIEAFSSLQKGAFHHEENTLWVNQFVAADIDWKDQGVIIYCETAFPNDGKVRLTVQTEGKKDLTFKIRKPHWVQGEVAIFCREQPIAATEKQGYLTLRGSFGNGDVISFELPFAFRTNFLLDRREYVNLFYGPHLMVAVGYDKSLFQGNMEELAQSMKPTGYPLEFYADLHGRVVWMPLCAVRNEVYSGFIKVNAPAKQILTDTVRLDCKEDLQAHQFVGKKSFPVYREGRYGMETDVGGTLEYRVAVSPTAQMQVRCQYNGDDTHFFGHFDAAAVRVRLFDLQIKQADGSYQTFATQTLDGLHPQGEEHINYPIPIALTVGKTAVTLRFAAKNFGTANGVVGGLYEKIQLFYL